jgi:hypothetical protein
MPRIKKNNDLNKPNQVVIENNNVPEQTEQTVQKSRKPRSKKLKTTDEIENNNVVIAVTSDNTNENEQISNIENEQISNIVNEQISNIVNEQISNIENEVIVSETTPAPEQEQDQQEQEQEHSSQKKRGRKPKGGKIIQNTTISENQFIPAPNIILHLKCCIADLNQNNCLDNNVSQSTSVNTTTNINTITNNVVINNNNNNNDNEMLNNSIGSSNKKIDSYNFDKSHITDNCQQINENITYNLDNSSNQSSNNVDNNKLISMKLKELAYNLHNNDISDKKSACFWCTCDFDNPPIFIPKYELNDKYYCYGCFCSPECATAYLFKEPIDNSTRFERYHLLNHIYCKMYDYKINIKPAPDPFYTLNKYYGNLSIQEYRKLLKNERLLLVVEKPLSRVLPELHEDNEDAIFNGQIIQSSTKFEVKRKTKQPTKNNILSENFNLGGVAP